MPSPPPRTLVLSFPIAVLTLMSIAGTAAAPWLIGDYPLLLVLLSPRSVFLADAARDVSLPLFLVVGLVRLMAADPFHFLLGRLHGQRAVSTTAARWPRVGAWVPRVQRAIARGGTAAVVVSPTSKTLVVAGATGAPWRGVAAADVAGTTVRLLLLYAAGAAFVSLV